MRGINHEGIKKKDQENRVKIKWNVGDVDDHQTKNSAEEKYFAGSLKKGNQKIEKPEGRDNFQNDE